MIYFDNAATSFPKPKQVIEAVTYSVKNHGNAGRGGYKISFGAAEQIFRARLAAASFFGSLSPERVIFTASATMSLNIAIKSFAKRGSHILTSCFEHNSVLRPLNYLKSTGAASYDIFDVDLENDENTAHNVLRTLKPETKMIVLTHVSNVSGKILPIKEIISRVKSVRDDIVFVVDAAQSAGTLQIDIHRDNIDILCAPSHKGLLGIAGAGIIIFNDNFKPATENLLIHGGTGINSLDEGMPDELPEKFEAGTLNTPAIASVAAGIDFINTYGREGIYKHEKNLREKAFEMLANTDNIIVYGGDSKNNYAGPILFNVKGKDNVKIAKILSENDICVRSGYHCSPLAHKKLGTLESGGIRISFGYANNIKELNEFYKVLKKAMT